MSNTTAGLSALLILALLTFGLFALGRLSATGHGSRARDLKEILTSLRSAQSVGEKVLIYGYYLRALFRVGYWGAAASAIAVLAAAAGAIFGGGWELARQMLCDVLRFLETMLNGKAETCEPPPGPPPANSGRHLIAGTSAA